MTTPVLARRVTKARRASVCPVCHEAIRIGQYIALTDRWQHIGHVVARQPNVRDAITGGHHGNSA